MRKLFDLVATYLVAVVAMLFERPAALLDFERLRHDGLFVFADISVASLQQRMIELSKNMAEMQAKADGENRALTEDERDGIGAMLDEFDNAEEDVKRRKGIEDAQARAAANTPAAPGRQTPAEGPRAGPGDEDDDPEEVDPTARRSRRVKGAPAIIQNARQRERWGFHNFGEFSQAVVAGSRKAGPVIDPRLVVHAAAPTTYSTEGIGADGGYAIPPEFRQAIMEKVLDEANLLGMTDQLESSSNSISIPTDETTPWQTSGGVQAYWENEAAAHTQSKMALQSVQVRLNKITALVGVSEELVQDAPALDTYLRRKAPQKINFKVSRAIVGGTGAGQPLGILNSPAKVTVSKESSQVADTICFENVTKMWARMYSECWRNSVWLASQDCMQQLLALGFNATNPAGSSAFGGTPVYLPPGGLSASPYGTLLGRPVRFTEACETIGDEGDIILWDPTQYMTAMRVGGVRADVSMHLWFDYDLQAFRFILRIAGIPWWSAAITPRAGSLTKSCIVTLEAR